MRHKKMTVEEVVDHLINDDSFDDFAFRGDDFVPVKRFRKSKYHGDDRSEYQLNGVSAIHIPALNDEYIKDAIRQARKYGKNIFLLRGESQNADDTYNDPGEICMVSHEIVCIVE
jgi:hypothetical protein